MNDKFKNIPTEDDTHVIIRLDIKVGELDAVYESWHWEGVNADSIIFLTEDIKLSDIEFNKILSDLKIIGDLSKITVKESGEYTFVNFNFETT